MEPRKATCLQYMILQPQRDILIDIDGVWSM